MKKTSIFQWCTLALFVGYGVGALQAANNATGTFTAKITAGTCSVALGSKVQTLHLGQVGANNVQSSAPLLTSDASPQTLDVNCTGYPAATSKPTLKVTGADVGSAGSSLFRDAGDANPSTSLGFRVQAVKNGVAPNWASATYLNNDAAFSALDVGKDANNAKIPVRFTMWCVPGAKGEADCKQAGALQASLTFSFDYE